MYTFPVGSGGEDWYLKGTKKFSVKFEAQKGPGPALISIATGAVISIFSLGLLAPEM